jgi:hypothetical protein
MVLHVAVAPFQVAAPCKIVVFFRHSTVLSGYYIIFARGFIIHS